VISVEHGDCLDVLGSWPPAIIDACVTDPPYELAFMGRAWDQTGVAFDPDTWRAVFRVLKPGAHLLAFGGARTAHRMTCAIEDAGFEIRDTLCWLYGSGFPKSLDVSKAIDKAAGAERIKYPGPYASRKPNGSSGVSSVGMGDLNGDVSDPATDAARQWQGWGTALKPAHEPIILARKPFRGTVAANVLAHGTGAINVDACRVATNDALGGGGEKAETSGKFTNEGWRRPWMDDPEASEAFAAKVRANVARAETLGRFPANVVHDGSPEVEAAFAAFGDGFGDSGSSSRFFYSAKATARDRADSKHPTVKPIALMAWLVRMVTPPGGVVLDPFAGSGTTGEAAMLEGFDALLIERDATHATDIRHRIKRWSGLDAPLFAEAAS
jgi:DNA modification methylase